MKKLICLMLAAIMIFALAACMDKPESETDSGRNKNEITLEQYKTNAQERLDAYVIEKGEDNYTIENWAKLNERTTEGKALIAEAKDKQEIDAALLDAKGNMDDIPIIAFDMVKFSSWYSLRGSLLNNRIKLSDFRSDVVYECSVDGGGIHYADRSNVKVIANPGETIQWYPSSIANDESREKLAFLEIRVKSGDKIVGYALLEFYLVGFYYVDEDPYYDSERVGADSYQPVRLITEAYTAKSSLSFTEEYVDEMIDKAKNYTPEMNDEIKQIVEQKFSPTYPITYYGEYNGAHVFLENTLSLAMDYPQIAGVRFSWGSVHSFLVLKDGVFYSLDMKYFGIDYDEIYGGKDALEYGILTKRDIEVMGGLYGRLKYQ